MVNIIFNASNYDRNSKKYKKEFSTNQTLHDMKVSLTSLSLYNSFFNVSAANNNNVINIKFLGTTYSTTLEDGYYSVSDLNYAMQNLMIENSLYVKSGTTNIFFIELVTNSVRYSIQLNSYLIPTNIEAGELGYTKPENAEWVFPSSPKTPTITFNTSFGLLIGYFQGTYPLIETINSSLLSKFSPQISVVNSLILTCNLVSNPGITIPHDTFYSFGLSAAYGDQMKEKPYPIWNDIRNGTYQYIEISVYDQNLNSLEIYDTDGAIVLTLEDK